MSKGLKMIGGDVVVNTKTIEVVQDDELLRQTVELVLATNRGEWEFDPLEGIDRKLLLRKGYNADDIRGTIEAACLRVDPTLTLTDFDLSVDARRHAKIKITLVKPDGDTIEVTAYAD